MNSLLNKMSYINKVFKRNKKSINIFILGFILGNIVLIISTLFIELSVMIKINNPLIISLLIFILFLLSIYIIKKILKNQRFTDLNYMLDELEKEKEIKEALFHLNHEIKNPLAVVNGYLQMIDRTNDNKKKDKYLDIIKKEIERSITIINDFTEMGRIKKLDLEPLDLSVIIDEIKDMTTPILRINNSMIHYNNLDEIYILGDYERLKQVFLNIIKNSIEAKDKDFLIIDIEIKKLKNIYKIYIKDNGKGMKKEELNHLSDSFFTTKKTGTGIGTTYVKKIIEMHHGKIEFKSKEKEGTTAIVTLPIMN